MKKAFSYLMAALLALSCVPALADDGGYEGVWVWEAYTLYLERLDDHYCATILAPESPEDITVWVYSAVAYDEAAGGLVTVKDGTKTRVLYDENGERLSTEELFADGAASFALTEDNVLVWTDYNEAPGEDTIAFERGREVGPALTADAMLRGYLRPIAALETGTAGASLKLASASAQAALFAAGYEMWQPDDVMYAALIGEAWDGLDSAEKDSFAARFGEVSALIDSCLEDWDAQKGLFDDAGATEYMEAIVFDPLNRLAWETLRDLTKDLLD